MESFLYVELTRILIRVKGRSPLSFVRLGSVVNLQRPDGNKTSPCLSRSPIQSILL